ncbi:hypothetical protein [Fulvivirga ligni]|uniref:hypothetical protein n=1 Tax=Fulvivirga ligni TaxID=2904246 RepID=UPI001F3FCBEB|nr:hypothetical protein [Fulvivirga ligni]UII20685.1 hypothetical protein LVD16_22860 [Fulvivirga ligni]
MKSLKYILILTIVAMQMACQKDPLEEIEEGDWNNERSIINIKFANQVGQAEIVRDDESTGHITIAINVAAVPDLSNIALNSVQLSYGATATLKEGESLNFENADKSATVTVTSPTGKSREYIITATEFTETIVGTYDINNLIVYGGTGPEYGGGAVMPLTDKPWVWPEADGPHVELDNVLTFELEGFTEEGNTYGKFTNSAGEDGLYANFNFVGDPETDVNNFYRKLPKGEGTWARNYTSGMVTFTFSDGHTTSGTFVGSGTEDLGNGLSKTVDNNALAFTLNGTDNWDKIYSDYDKFVSKPRKFWIDITKRN